MKARAASLLWVALAACAFVLVVAAHGSVAPPEDEDQPEQTNSAGARCHVANPGRTTKDHEVVFGRRKHPTRAHVLVWRVRRSGFRKVRIEREGCMYEVAVIFLTKSRAERTARRALRLGWNVRIMVS